MVDPVPKYSVCITNRNSMPTIRAALESIVANFEGLDAEFIVVDQNSHDGSDKVIEEFAAKVPNFKMVRDPRRGRGIGRRVAESHARGEYQVHHMDMDETYRPIMPRILKYYHEELEAKVGDCTLVAAVMITPTRLIRRAGSFEHTINHEEALMNARLAALAPLFYMPVRFSEHNQHPRRKKLRGKFQEAFESSRETMRIHALGPWRTYRYVAAGGRPGIQRLLAAVPFVCGWIDAKRQPNYPFPLDPRENLDNPFDYLIRRLGDLEGFMAYCGGRHLFTVYEGDLAKAKQLPPMRAQA